jgi:hypothetical protein
VAGQSREHWWRNVNMVTGDFPIYTDSGRYVNEFGAYSQLDWDGGECAVNYGIRTRGNALDYKLMNLHLESGARMFDIQGPGSQLIIEGCRIDFGANGAFNGEIGFFDGSQLSITDTYFNVATKRATVALSNANAKPMIITLKNVRAGIQTPMPNGTPPRLNLSPLPRGCSWRVSPGQTLIFTWNPGAKDFVANTTTLTCTFQAGDFADTRDVRGWEIAKAINRDCGKNWKPSTAYLVNDVVVPGTIPSTWKKDANRQVLEYKVYKVHNIVSNGLGDSSGLSDSTEPVWPTTVGSKVVDNQVTWLCQQMYDAALFASSDAMGNVYIDVKGVEGVQSPYDGIDSPPALFTGGGYFQYGGTALVSNGGDLYFAGGGGAYSFTEIAYLSQGFLSETSLGNTSGTPIKFDVDIDGLAICDTNMQTVKTVSGKWALPAVSWVTAANTGVDWTGPQQRQLTSLSVSSTPTPLQNTGGLITFSGDNQYAGDVFDQPEWNTGFRLVLSPFPTSFTGYPAPQTAPITIVKSQYGIRARRTPAVGAGNTETYEYKLTRDAGGGFDPSKITTATLKGWFKNESLFTTLDWNATGWVNAAQGTNLIGALKQTISTNYSPTVTQAADGVYEVSFNGTADTGQWCAGTISDSYAVPLHYFFVVKWTEFGSSGAKMLFSQGQDSTSGAQHYMYYRSDVHGWYGTAGTVVNLAVKNIEDDFHVVCITYDSIAVRLQSRTSMVFDNGSVTSAVSVGSNALGGFTLGARYTTAGVSGWQNQGSFKLRGDVVVVQGMLSIEEKRKIIQYLTNKAATVTSQTPQVPAPQGLPPVENGFMSPKPTDSTISFTDATRTFSIQPAVSQSVAGTTGASIAPIVLTVASTTGFTSGDTVVVASVGGNTAANGNWIVKVVDSAHLALEGSTGSGSWTSGGTVSKSFAYYSGGRQFFSSGATVQIANTEGLHYIYFDKTGTLVETTTFSNLIITDYAYAAAVYWDASNAKAILLADERHGRSMPSAVHIYLHKTLHAKWESGFTISGYTVDGTGNVQSDAAIGVAAGVFADEDILHSLSALTYPVRIPILYRFGANGDWRKINGTGYIATTTGSGRPAWNQYTGGAWQLTKVTNTDMVVMHLIATNNAQTDQLFLVVGQNQYATVAAARAGAKTEWISILRGAPCSRPCGAARVAWRCWPLSADGPCRELTNVT